MLLPDLRTIADIPHLPSIPGTDTPYTEQSCIISNVDIRLPTSCVETFSPFHLYTENGGQRETGGNQKT